MHTIEFGVALSSFHTDAIAQTCLRLPALCYVSGIMPTVIAIDSYLMQKYQETSTKRNKGSRQQLLNQFNYGLVLLTNPERYKK